MSIDSEDQNDAPSVSDADVSGRAAAAERGCRISDSDILDLTVEHSGRADGGAHIGFDEGDLRQCAQPCCIRQLPGRARDRAGRTRSTGQASGPLKK